MTQPTILVTGATGNTGGAVVSELLHRGVPVRAMVRTRDARSAALRACGAEVVVADIFDPDQLVSAMRGVQRAYYVPPYHPYVIQSAVTFAVAAREAKLEAIVQLGQFLKQSPQFVFFRPLPARMKTLDHGPGRPMTQVGQKPVGFLLHNLPSTRQFLIPRKTILLARRL